jgi:hypothetical protein
MFEVYKRMPNDTDFTVFKRAGVPGLNFAFIGDAQHYHAPTDDVAHFDLRSLQHDGSYALNLARHFGKLDLTKLNGPDAIYFDLFGRSLVHYPVTWAVPLALLATVLFVGRTRLEIKRGHASLGQLALGWLATAVSVLIVAVIFRFSVDLLAWLMRDTAPGWLDQFIGWPYWFAAIGLTVATTTTLFIVFRRWISPPSLALGGLLWWVILAIASAVWLPGASYVILWPLLFGLLGVTEASSTAEVSWNRFAMLATTALPTMILVMPLVFGFFIALGPRVMFVPMIVLSLGLGALTLQIEAVSKPWKWTLPVTGLLVMLAAVIG